MNCPNCNGVVPDSAKVCGYCGYRILVPDPQQEVGSLVENVVSPVKRKKKRLVWIIPVGILVIILLLVLVGNILSSVSRSKTRDMVQKTLSAMSITSKSMELISTPLPEQVIEETPVSTLEYHVIEGDSCDSIASAYSITIQLLLDANSQSLDCGMLSIGQLILIPVR